MKKLDILGVATVAGVKDTNTKEIMVNFAGWSPTADGRALAQVKMQEESAPNANGEVVTSKSLTSNTHPATWAAIGEPNRITPPDVREGSQVAIYQVQGQDKLYWTSFGVSTETHRLETVIWGYNASPNTDQDVPFDVNDYYMIAISTHTGHMTIRTSQANGEKSAFEIKVDGAAGNVVVRGSNDSVMEFNDHEASFTYQNKDKSTVNVDRKVMTLLTEDTINVFGKLRLMLKTQHFGLECETIKIKADTADVKIGQTNWEGNIFHEGLHVQEGDSIRDGSTMSTGVVQGLQGVRSAETDLDTHTTSFVESGKGTSGPPVPVPQPPVLKE